VAIIDSGRLLYQGKVADLMAQGQRTRLKTNRLDEAFELLSKDQRLTVTRNGDQSIYLQTAAEEIPEINALLVQHGFRVMEISSQGESLEEVFLRLTRDARLPEKP
jgi:ABC-type multidrug transport system ATPase subunit